MNRRGILRTGVGLSKMLMLCALILCATTTSYAIPRFVGSSRLFEISQEGRFSRQAPAVERIETAASFYDFYSASSHTGFEYTRRSLVFLYRDLRDEDNLSIFLLHGVDDMGQPAHEGNHQGRCEVACGVSLQAPESRSPTTTRVSSIGARIATADSGKWSICPWLLGLWQQYRWWCHRSHPHGRGLGDRDRYRALVRWTNGVTSWRTALILSSIPTCRSLIRSRAENAGDAAQKCRRRIYDGVRPRGR